MERHCESNANAIKPARMVMKAGGAGKDEAWYREAQEKRTERREVIIPNPIPIRVFNGDKDAAGAGSGAE